MTGPKSASASSPPSTVTTPDEDKAGNDDPNLATWLLWCETGQLFRLKRSDKSLSISSNLDTKPQIYIPNRQVSAQHGRLVLTRTLRGGWVWTMRDGGSKNGTFFDGERYDSFPVAPGTMFFLGGLVNRMIALDDEMHRRYPALVDILGDESEHPVEGKSETPRPWEMLLVAGSGSHMLILSEPHCEQAQLARIIHEISPQRDRTLVELRGSELPMDGEGRKALKKLAARSTLVLDLGNDDRPLDRATLEMLFKSRNRIRVIVLAAHEGTAFQALGGLYYPEQRFKLRPLAERRTAIVRLLDHELKQQGSALRVALLTTRNRYGLQSAEWRENFASLRQAARWLAAVFREGSVHKAAISLDMVPSTLWRRLDRLGVDDPLLPTSHRSNRSAPE
jgi:hypothetical protein